MNAGKLEIDWEAAKLEWIYEARRVLLPRLLSDKRFPDSAKLAQRFEAEVSAWSNRRTAERSFRGVINIGNELAAAAALLEEYEDLTSLRYEPRMRSTAQTIDFCLYDADRNRTWIDVKTIAPKWLDDDEGWQRFQTFAADFPENASFGVQRAFGGAGIFGQAIKSRWSFVTRTIELEQKAALIPLEDRGPVWLMFCSDRFAWHRDDLEDFADFYREGLFRDDDWASNAIARYLSDNGLSLARSLAGFHYFGRRHEDLDGELRLAVRGPRVFAPDVSKRHAPRRTR